LCTLGLPKLLNYYNFGQEPILVTQFLQAAHNLVMQELRLCSHLTHFDQFREAINPIDSHPFAHILNRRFFYAPRVFGALENFPLLFYEIGGKHL